MKHMSLKYSFKILNFLVVLISLTLISLFYLYRLDRLKVNKLDHNYEDYHYFISKTRSQAYARKISSNLNLKYVGNVGELTDYHLFTQLKSSDEKKSKFIDFNRIKELESLGSQLEGVESFQHQKINFRLKRGWVGKGRPMNIVPLNMTRYHKLGIEDPGFPRQWHFHNQENVENDINVVKLWEEGITGKGVVVAIVDDGIDYEHEDIRDNYFAEGSYDFNFQKPNPMPSTPEDTHGTRCAGQIAGVRNRACGVGIAYEAKVAGIRILSKDIGDFAEATAINYKFQDNHVYSCSWGPPDDGLAMDRPPKIVEDAIENGILKGRGGLGTVFVFASGNGGFKGDNCNFDGYTNSIYSITVGSIDGDNQHPGYSEACTALMITAYSSGVSGPRIYTSSSWNNQCTDSHGGTSAAAPMLAGIIALALQKRPDLNWRDFQHISVQTAIPVTLEDDSWSKTATGRMYSPKFGFGKVDGYKFVKHALNFTSVNPQTRFTTPKQVVDSDIPNNPDGIHSTIKVAKDDLDKVQLQRLEHITVMVNITHQRRSDLIIDLVSPNGVISNLAVPRSRDDTDKGFEAWQFMTVKHWEENPIGEWKLLVIDRRDPNYVGKFHWWSITFYGEHKLKNGNSKDSSSPPTIQSQPELSKNTVPSTVKDPKTNLGPSIPSTVVDPTNTKDLDSGSSGSTLTNVVATSSSSLRSTSSLSNLVSTSLTTQLSNSMSTAILTTSSSTTTLPTSTTSSTSSAISSSNPNSKNLINNSITPTNQHTPIVPKPEVTPATTELGTDKFTQNQHAILQQLATPNLAAYFILAVCLIVVGVVGAAYLYYKLNASSEEEGLLTDANSYPMDSIDDDDDYYTDDGMDLGMEAFQDLDDEMTTM